MKKKAEKPVAPKHTYHLSINTPLLFLLQKITGDSTYKITSYFYDIMVKQRAEIEARMAEKKNYSYSMFYQKKSYGYYPGTEAYCIICTSRKPAGGYYSPQPNGNTEWDCNVSLIRGTTDFNHEDLEKLMAEGILLGDAAGKPVEAPHLKKRGRKDDLAALKDNTDPNKDV